MSTNFNPDVRGNTRTIRDNRDHLLSGHTRSGLAIRFVPQVEIVLQTRDRTLIKQHPRRFAKSPYALRIHERRKCFLASALFKVAPLAGTPLGCRRFPQSLPGVCSGNPPEVIG